MLYRAKFAAIVQQRCHRAVSVACGVVLVHINSFAVQQIRQSLAAAMSGFVNLHLVVSLQLQSLDGLEEELFGFDGRIDLDLQSTADDWPWSKSARPSLGPGTLCHFRRLVHRSCAYAGKLQ